MLNLPLFVVPNTGGTADVLKLKHPAVSFFLYVQQLA